MSIANFHPNDLLAILPELALVVLAGVIMTMDIVLAENRKRLLGLTTAVGSFVIIAAAVIFSQPNGELIWGGMISNDMVAFIFRLVFIFAGGITALLSVDVKGVAHKGDYYAIILGAVVGMCFMALAADIIMLYLAVETTGIAGYVLAGYVHRSSRSAEAGLKYFLFGAATSAVMLYGLSLVYGFTGETNLTAIASVLASGKVGISVILASAILILVGVGFKIAIVPFHFWAPDVYEGAPTPVTGFISTAAKTAGFAVLIRVFITGLTASEYWLPILVALAALTMTIGNLLALAQKNIKRLLAYSSIAHAGYALVAFVALSELGVAATVFYLMVYVITNLAAFGVVILVSRSGAGEEIAGYAGMSRRSPYLALAMLVAFLSLAGMPPLAGFFGKFYVFAAAMKAGLVWLALVGVLNAIIGLYYYLVVLKVVYVSPPQEGALAIEVPRAYSFALVILSVGIVLLGTAASPWFEWALSAAQGIF
ncbi:MAG: NADH-quinone oxidoreductase subunit N [Anaerolineales bacterium]|nr:NADH-quinone oxidoreductase subunit N [Anaerolineales bacterium]